MSALFSTGNRKLHSLCICLGLALVAFCLTPLSPTLGGNFGALLGAITGLYALFVGGNSIEGIKKSAEATSSDRGPQS